MRREPASWLSPPTNIGSLHSVSSSRHILLCTPSTEVSPYTELLSSTRHSPKIVSRLKSAATATERLAHRGRRTYYRSSTYTLNFTVWRQHASPKHDIAYPYRRPAGAATSACSEQSDSAWPAPISPTYIISTISTAISRSKRIVGGPILRAIRCRAGSVQYRTPKGGIAPQVGVVDGFYNGRPSSLRLPTTAEPVTHRTPERFCRYRPAES